MNSDEPVFEYFCDYLAQHHGWHFPILVGMCDRCAADGAIDVAMGEPFPVQLQLCPACLTWARVEAAKEFSGVMGLAGVYALAYAIGRSSRPVKGPKGGERSSPVP